MSDLTPIEQRFRMANPVPDPSNPPMTVSPAAAALLDIDARSIDMQTQVQEPLEQPLTESPAPKRRLIVALAAATVIIVIVAAALFNGADETTQTDVIAPDDDPISYEPEPVPFGEDYSLAVVDDYFAANSAADFDALLALFTPEATFSGVINIAGEEEVFAWNAAQGTQFTEPDCTVPDEPSAQAVNVRCNFFNRDVLVQAVDGPQVPITLILTVTPDGISNEHGLFSQPDFNKVSRPFNSWMIENHPGDAEKVEFGDWTSIEEADAGGTLRAQYAREWATYLEANGCTYLDGC